MKTKILILALMFVLLIPLYIAADNLTGHEKREIKTASIIVTISTTSDWARVSFNGASIKDYKVLDRTDGLKDPIIDQTGVILNKRRENNASETIRLGLEISVFDEKPEIVITKDYTGEVNVRIDGIGEYNNTKKPLQVPVTIETTSDWTKIDFNGATVRNARVLDINGTTLREPIIGTESIILAKLEANDTSYGSAKFLVDLSLDTPMPTVTLEKANNGKSTVTIGGIVFVNDQITSSNLRNIPVTIETTSNKTELSFKGLYIKKAQTLSIDNESLIESIVGSDFIFLNYSHAGNSYRKASYLIDFGVTDTPSNITITKNDPGYAVVNFATYDFIDTGRGKNKSITYSIDPANLQSTATREPLFELDQIEENRYLDKTLPLRIETTSDWTEITLKDVTITSAEIKSTTGDIEKPGIGSNNVLIKKPKSYDNSFAAAELLLHIDLNEDFIDQHKDTMTMTIAKGDIGATTVQVGNIESFVNAENIKNDPRNTKIYEIPLNALLIEKKNENKVLYNPATYSVPLFNELYKQNIESADTQEMLNTYSISADMLPRRDKINFSMRKSEAAGLLSGVILSYLILIILGIQILSKEGFFDFIPGLIGENKTTVQTMSVFTVKLFEKTPASSLFILEALIVLAITPFVLMLDQTYAEGTAILAYFLLVFGVLLRLVGQSERANRIFKWQDFPMVMFLIKTASVVMLLSSLVIAGYELKGLYGAFAAFIPGLLFVVLVPGYVRKHFEKGSYAIEW